MKPERSRCERCGEFLQPARGVWLALDTRVGKYTDKEIPAEFDQGGFVFGKACATRELKEYEAALVLMKEKHA